MAFLEPPPAVDALLAAGHRLACDLEYPEIAFIDAARRVDQGMAPAGPAMRDLGRAKMVARCPVARGEPGFRDLAPQFYRLLTALSGYLLAAGGDWMGVYRLVPDTFEAMAVRAVKFWQDGTQLPRAFWACIDSVERTVRRSVAIIQATRAESAAIVAAFRDVRLAIEQSRLLTKQLLHAILTRSNRVEL